MTVTERGSPSAAVREQVDHPIIDADGHFLELSPLFLAEMTERIEAFGGAGLRDRFTAAGVLPYDQRAPGAGDDPSETRRPARPWWGWPTRNTLDRATGHFPGCSTSGSTSSASTSRSSTRATASRTPTCSTPTSRRARPRDQRDQRGGVPSVCRSHDAGGGDPDAHAGAGDRRSRVRGERARAEGDLDRRLRDAADPADPPRAPRAVADRELARHLRPRQRARLRPVLAEVRRPQGGAGIAQRDHLLALDALDLELHVQPHQRDRARARVAVQVAVHGWRDPPVPDVAVRVPRRWCRVGLRPVCRHDRPLGEAQRRGGARARPGRARRRPLAVAARQARRRQRAARTPTSCEPGSRDPIREATRSTSGPRARSRRRATSATCSCRASTSGARPTTR